MKTSLSYFDKRKQKKLYEENKMTEQTNIPTEQIQTTPQQQPTQTNTNNWLQQEQQELEANKFDGEVLPSLKLEENKITTVQIDFSKEFEKWVDNTKNPPVIKKIIPVMHEGVKKNFWFNFKNPVYREIINAGSNGVTTFKILQTGNGAHTRYNLVKD